MRRSGSGMPTRPSHSMALARAASPRSAVCASIASTIWSPTRITGFRLVAGSWKIMPMRAAAHAAHLGFGQRQHVRAVELHVAGADAAVLGQQAHQRQRGHALAAARFADQREGLAALDASGACRRSPARCRRRRRARPSGRRCSSMPAALMAAALLRRAARGRKTRARAGRRRRARRRRTGWPPAPA